MGGTHPGGAARAAAEGTDPKPQYALPRSLTARERAKAATHRRSASVYIDTRLPLDSYLSETLE